MKNQKGSKEEGSRCREAERERRIPIGKRSNYKETGKRKALKGSNEEGCR
jgi:hypothetical protein